jgi:hypothetical protein
MGNNMTHPGADNISVPRAVEADHPNIDRSLTTAQPTAPNNPKSPVTSTPAAWAPQAPRFTPAT